MQNAFFKAFVMLFCLACPKLYAQQTISGKVIDAVTQEPLPGVSIVVEGTSKGTATDQEGNFSMNVQEKKPLIVSFIGYQKKTIVPEKNEITISLQPSLLELSQVIVSASRKSQSRTDAPIAIGKITPKTLEDTKPASLEQVVNKVSGVYMMNLGNEQQGMSIRQPLSLKSLFLYLEDGIPIRPTGVFNHNALIEINMAALKTIEVVKGPASSIYGSEAIGGSINFITPEAPAIPTANISLQGDNLGYKRVDFGAGTTVKKVGLYVGGYYADRTNGYREHNDFNKLGLTLRGDVRIGERDKLTTTASIINYHSDMSGSIDSADFYSKNYPSDHTFTERTVKALRIRSTFDHYWSDKGKTAFTVFFRDNSIGQIPSYRVRNNFTDPTKATGVINDNSFTSYGTIIQHNQELGWLDARLIGGLSLDFSPNTYYAEYIDIERDEAGMYVSYTRPDSVLTDYAVGLLNTAAYAQFEFNPLTRLHVVMAARYDRFDYDYDNHLTPDAFSGAPDSKDHFENFSPKIGFTYDFGKERGVYGNYSIGFVPPQVGELYRGVKVPVMEPSVYYNLEAGGWFSFAQKAKLDVSLYQLRGTNEIITVFLDDGTVENRNAGETLHQGIEYSINYAPHETFSLRFGGTNARHEYVEFEESGKNYDGNTMAGAPGWIANSEVMYYPAFLKGARITLEWQHLGPYYMDPANSEKYEGFDVLNLRMGYRFKGFEGWFNILNLTNQLYATRVSKSVWGKTYSPGDPRTFSVGVGYRFSAK